LEWADGRKRGQNLSFSALLNDLADLSIEKFKVFLKKP